MSKKLNKSQISKFSNFTKKSTRIRYLNSLGYSRGEIVKYLNDNGDPTIYQHVRNVLITPVKNPVENF